MCTVREYLERGHFLAEGLLFLGALGGLSLQSLGFGLDGVQAGLEFCRPEKRWRVGHCYKKTVVKQVNQPVL